MSYTRDGWRLKTARKCYNQIVMGVITIEVPQRMKKVYRIVSEDSARDVIDELDKLVKRANHVDLSGIVGLWADRPESAEDIGRDLRRKSNSRVKNA